MVRVSLACRSPNAIQSMRSLHSAVVIPRSKITGQFNVAQQYPECRSSRAFSHDVCRISTPVCGFVCRNAVFEWSAAFIGER